MKILFFIALFTTFAIRVNSQSTLPLRADTVVIEKVGGNATLKIKGATRDTLGVATNVGGGVIVFKKSRKINDTSFVVGNDTIRFSFGGSVVTIYSGDGVLDGDRHISGGANGYSFRIDSSSSISLFSGLEYISSGIGSFIQMSDSVMNIGASSVTDFTSFVFSPTRIKFTAADGAGSSGDVWTNTGSGYGHWEAGGGGGSGPPSLTYKYLAFGGIGGALSPGEAAAQYDSITNKLLVDSADLIQARADSIFLRNQAEYPKPDTAYGGVNSLTVGQGASVQDSAYFYRECAGLDVIPVNIAVSGTGATSGANRFLINKNPGNTTAAIFMDGFNDPRRNGLPRKTLNKIINSHKAIFANQYLKVYTNAGTGGVGVTRSGSWTASWNAQGEGGKTTVGAYTSSTGDYIEYAFTDSTVIVGLMPGDGSSGSYIGTDIEVKIDGVVVGTINTNNQTDGISDGSGLDNHRCAAAFIYTGLTNASHTIRLTKLSTGGGGFMICDYFGHLVDRSQAQLMLWHHIPHMTSAGYATAPYNLATPATTDTVNAKIDSLKTTYPISIYPTYVVPTNTVYDPATDADPDGIHMADAGYRKVADLALNVTLNDAVHAPGVDGAMYFDNEFKGVVNGLKETFLMRRAANAAYIQNQSYFTQTGDYKISGTGTAQKFTSAGTIFGDGLTIADRQTNGIVAGTASGNVFFEMRNNYAGPDAKSYGWFLGSNGAAFRLLSDNVASETRILDIIRTGLTLDTIRMPMLDITGKLKIYVADVTGNSDSAFIRSGNEVKYARINGGVSSVNSQTGAVTITAGTGITTSTLSGDVTIAVDINNSALPHTIATYFTDVANSGTSETDLYSTTTGANTLNSNGQTLYFDYTINVSDITATADLAIYFAGTSIGNTGALTVSATGAWRVVGSITRATSTTARATVAINSPGASTASYTNETDLTSQNFATTNIVKITGQAGGAGGGSGDITAKMGKLYYQP